LILRIKEQETRLALQKHDDDDDDDEPFFWKQDTSFAVNNNLFSTTPFCVQLQYRKQITIL